jgi:hypothetical protein
MSPERYATYRFNFLSETLLSSPSFLDLCLHLFEVLLQSHDLLVLPRLEQLLHLVDLLLSLVGLFMVEITS